jgi:hypothetical protein
LSNGCQNTGRAEILLVVILFKGSMLGGAVRATVLRDKDVGPLAAAGTDIMATPAF